MEHKSKFFVVNFAFIFVLVFSLIFSINSKVIAQEIPTGTPEVPSTPVLNTPANEAYTNDNTPDFRWDPITGVDTSYQLQIDNLATFAAPVDVDVNGLLTSTYTAPVLTDGLKYWRVRAYNNGNPAEVGTWSASRSIIIDTTAPLPPVLRLPLDGVIEYGNPGFLWFASEMADVYQLALDYEVNCPSPFYISNIQEAFSFTLPSIVLGTFNWCVRAGDNAGNLSDWSTSRTITIHQAIPGMPFIASPENGLITQDNTPEFNWHFVSQGYEYEIQIDNLASFAAPIEQTAITGLSYIAAPLTNGLKYWRVRAINNEGEAGPWTLTRKITIAAIIPPTATPTATNTFTPTLTRTPTQTPSPLPPVSYGTYDDRSPNIVYTGTWGNKSITGNYLNTEKYSAAIGSTAQFNFTGENVTVIYRGYPNTFGNMGVKIDGVDVGVINQSTSSQKQQLRWSSGDLGVGVHTIVLTHLTGTYVTLDGFIVSGPPTATPTATNTFTPTLTRTPTQTPIPSRRLDMAHTTRDRQKLCTLGTWVNKSITGNYLNTEKIFSQRSAVQPNLPSQARMSQSYIAVTLIPLGTWVSR